MTRLLAATVLAAVEVGAAFGAASASVGAVSGDSMTVDIEVEVKVSAQAVVAHLAFPGAPSLTVPLLDRGGGAFGARVEVEARNYLVVFEAVGASDGMSDPVSLRDMGADLGSGGELGAEPVGDGGAAERSGGWGWAALALGAASLSVFAFWVFSGGDKAAVSEKG